MITRRRVTIKQVAQASGVSTQTVSRVLNDRPDVSEETRRRVRSVIAELGYSPNALARSLIQGHSNTLGVVSYGLSYYGPARVLTGIERRAAELGYSILFGLLRSPETNFGEAIFQNLVDRQVDGIIWAVPEISGNRDWLLETLHIPAPVMFLNMQPSPGVSMAAIDNREGGRLAAQHLLDRGYRHIGLIAGPPTWWEAQQRAMGWQQALANAGITPDPSLVVYGDWYPSSGASGLSTLLDRHPNLQAVFACNDPMAAGALQTARRMGRRVPEDLAVIGFDDVPEAAFYHPALTTVRQPLVELGALAVERLHGMLRQPAVNGDPGAPAWLQPQLVQREST